MKQLFFFVTLLSVLQFTSCIKPDGPDGLESYTGVWNRVVAASGDRTDIAIGGISGEPSNRVYMCELRGSTAAGFYKGYLNGTTITWDAVHRLPTYEVSKSGSQLEILANCNICVPTFYNKGSWSGQCGPLNSSNNGGGTPPPPGGTTGQAMFWVATDLGCGNINVTINGVTRSITGYYGSAPSCGASSAANFTLNAGTYSYSASCSGKSWSGTISVTSGGCSKLQLTGTSGGTPAQGKVTFWTRLTNVGSITVTVAGVSKNVTGAYAWPALPPCGTAAYGANFSITPGTYNYTAVGTGKSWTGSFTVYSNQCIFPILD